MTQDDLSALKAYVKSNETGMNRAESTIVLNVSHSGLKGTNFMEIRFDLHMTIQAVKTKLCTMCGTSPSAMICQLRDEQNKVRWDNGCEISSTQHHVLTPRGLARGWQPPHTGPEVAEWR